MQVTMDIPDEVSGDLAAKFDDLGKAALEALAAEAYRRGTLTSMQVRLLLGHESRWETQEFLASRDALRSLSAAEILSDVDTAFSARVAS
jgi:hypothetical protein